MTDDLVRAEHLLDLNRPHEAETVLRSALNEDPSSARALRLLTQALNDQGKHEPARTAARSAVQADPEHEHGHRLLAISLGAVGRHGDAITSAEEAVRLAPHLWQTHVVLAGALVGRNDSERRDPQRADLVTRAVRHATEATRLAPSEPETHIALGLAFNAKKRARDAEACYREALRLDPSHAIAMNNLAAMNLDRGRIASGSELLSAGLTSAPQEETLRLNLDVLVLRLVLRVYFVSAISGLTIAVLAQASAAHAARLAVLAVMVAVIGYSTFTVFRRFGSGARRWMLSVMERLDGWGQWSVVLSILVTSAAVAMAVLPLDQATKLSRTIDSALTINLIVSAASVFIGSRSR